MGALTVKMAKAYNCKELWGCDLSDEAIRICADNCKEYDNFKGVFKVGNGATSNLKEHYFDVIIVPEVIEHMDDKAIDEMLDTIKFIAKPKATVVFSTQNRENLKDSIMLCPDCGCYFHKVQHVRAWSKESIVSFFQLRNIKVKKVYELNLIRSEWKRIKKICYRVYNSLFPLIKMMHKGKAYNLVVVCEITK